MGHFTYMSLSIKPMQLLSVKQAAVRLAVSERTLAKMLRRGDIKGFKLSGRYWRTSERHLEMYVVRQLQGPN